MSRERKLLVAVDQVSAQSLPWSLRHGSASDALEEALDLCIFLQDVTFLADNIKTDVPFNQAGMRGLMHVQSLLRDKLEIGMGVYKFPFLSWKDNAPALVEREEES